VLKLGVALLLGVGAFRRLAGGGLLAFALSLLAGILFWG